MKFLFSKMIKGLKNPKYSLWVLLGRYFRRIKSDESYIKWKWRFTMDYPLNLDHPTTYNEKQNWLKLHDRKPEYTMMVDKYLVKQYVASIIGEQYIIPTLGVWDSPEEIDFASLPTQFVLKCNHNSGVGMCICKNKELLDIAKVKESLQKGLSEDYYIYNREWPYKNVRRRIIAEQYMEDYESGELRDYKFFCFNGDVKCLFIATNRAKGDHETRFDFFDTEFNHLPFTNGHPNAIAVPSKPKCFEEMKRIASILSQGIPSSRIDLYEINGRVYFGEITFTHWGGFVPFDPPEWDTILGSWIDLPACQE